MGNISKPVVNHRGIDRLVYRIGFLVYNIITIIIIVYRDYNIVAGKHDASYNNTHEQGQKNNIHVNN